MTPYENTILQHLDRTGVDTALLTIKSESTKKDRRWVRVIIPTRVVKNPAINNVEASEPTVYQECQINLEFHNSETPVFFAGFIRGQISAKRPDILRQGWY